RRPRSRRVPQGRVPGLRGVGRTPGQAAAPRDGFGRGRARWHGRRSSASSRRRPASPRRPLRGAGERALRDRGRGRGARRGADPLARHPFVARLEAAPFSPPEPEGVDRTELRELVRRGLVVERDGCYFAPDAVEEAARRVAVLLATTPEGVTVAQVRDALGTTRKP